QFLMSANEALKSTETAVVTEESTTVATDTIGSLLTDTAKDSTAAAKNPLFDKFIGQGGGPILGVVAPKDTAVINSFLKRQDIRGLLPADKRFEKFVWGKQTTITGENNLKVDAVELYALKGGRDNKAAMSGGVVSDASDSFDQMGRPSVSMQMNGAGARAW